METVESIHAWLESTGWQSGRIRRDRDQTWWRKINVFPRCFHNRENNGIVVELTETDCREYGESDWVGYGVSLKAEADDGVWVDLSCYGMGLEDIKHHLERQIDKLAMAWVACQSGQGEPHGGRDQEDSSGQGFAGCGE
jgi:hypothetical protein